MIVGFGAKRSSTTDVGLVAHVIGDRDSVHIPFNIRSAIDGHILLEKNAEVLVFHNHPEWIANCVLDNTPWASQTDRRTMVTMAYRNLPSLARKILGKGGIRFYLGENGMVRQIRAPDVEDVLQFLGPKE